MTKSQNTKNEQLTEQWKKGELPEGHYYVKDGENMIAEYLDGYFYNDGNPMTSFSGGVDSVLDKVPSYDELQNMNEAVNQAMSANIKLVEQNAQLKELLKECRSAYLNAEKNYGYDDSIIEICSPMIDKIDEVLE